MRGFYVVKNPLVKPNMSINKGFSTIEGSTIEGFQCISSLILPFFTKKGHSLYPDFAKNTV